MRVRLKASYDRAMADMGFREQLSVHLGIQVFNPASTLGSTSDLGKGARQQRSYF